MYNKIGIKRLALAVIAQAFNDGDFDFLTSERCELYAIIAEINMDGHLIEMHKNNKIKIKKYYKRKKPYTRRKEVVI